MSAQIPINVSIYNIYVCIQRRNRKIAYENWKKNARSIVCVVKCSWHKLRRGSTRTTARFFKRTAFAATCETRSKTTRFLLQCVAVCCSVFQRGCSVVAVWLQYVNSNLAVSCIFAAACATKRKSTVCVLQSVALCRINLQRVAACCSELQWGATVSCIFATTCETISESTYSCCNMLLLMQGVAVCCSALQCVECVAAWCSVLQCVAYSTRLAKQEVNPPSCHCSVLQRVAACCSMLQCAAVCSHSLWLERQEVNPPDACCSLLHLLQYVAVCSSMLQCVAVCCSVLQCVAAWCSVLQCVAHSPRLARQNVNLPYSCCSLLNLLLCVAVCCSVLQRVAAYCSILQCAVVCCTFAVISETRRNRTRFMLQCVAVYCSVLQRVAAWCIVLQCLAYWQRLRDKKLNYQAASTVCCSALQYGTVCCSVLQCIVVSYIFAATRETTSATNRFVYARSLVSNKYMNILYMCVHPCIHTKTYHAYIFKRAYIYLYTRVLFLFFKSWTSPAITPGVWPHPQKNYIQITS